ncbi:MAG: GGDEF domain-containing protein, partial [Gammaproteobacteria bacterium]|nr:GGDEF domain-containing protein [Gammaproteobacteria bacterium]
MSIITTDVNNEALKAGKSYHQQRWQVIALYLLALIITMLLFGWLLREQYKQEIESAESQITARANVVTEWAKGVFAQSGQALFGLGELLAMQGMPDEDNTQALQRALDNLKMYVPMTDEIAVLAPTGRVLASSMGTRSAGVDISNTRFFNAFKQGGQQEIITPLHWSERDQAYYLYHGRRLDTSSGDFAGLVISSIAPRVFADALQQMHVYDGESIALIDSDSKLIARHPASDRFSIGMKVENSQALQGVVSGESFWSFKALSPIDGRERLFHMQRVG